MCYKKLYYNFGIVKTIIYICLNSEELGSTINCTIRSCYDERDITFGHMHVFGYIPHLRSWTFTNYRDYLFQIFSYEKTCIEYYSIYCSKNVHKKLLAWIFSQRNYCAIHFLTCRKNRTVTGEWCRAMIQNFFCLQIEAVDLDCICFQHQDRNGVYSHNQRIELKNKIERVNEPKIYENVIRNFISKQMRSARLNKILCTQKRHTLLYIWQKVFLVKILLLINNSKFHFISGLTSFAVRLTDSINNNAK